MSTLGKIINKILDSSTNTSSCDGFPCSYCKKDIDIIYDERGMVDRSNRIDTDLSTGDNPKSYLRSYHIKCWKKAIWD